MVGNPDVLTIINCFIGFLNYVMSMQSKKDSSKHYWCIVPQCTSTSLRTPAKTFIQVPKDPKRRKLWFEIAWREPKEFSKTSNVFMCEDHFDLEKDMENYLRWKLIGGNKIMKPDAIPHKFQCQKQRKLTSSQSIPDKSTENKRQLQAVKEAFSIPSCSFSNHSTSNLHSIDANFNDSVEELQSSNKDPPQPNGKQKDVGVLAKPYYRSKQTQTSTRFFCQNTSSDFPILKSIGTGI